MVGNKRYQDSERNIKYSDAQPSKLNFVKTFYLQLLMQIHGIISRPSRDIELLQYGDVNSLILLGLGPKR